MKAVLLVGLLILQVFCSVKPSNMAADGRLDKYQHWIPAGTEGGRNACYLSTIIHLLFWTPSIRKSVYQEAERVLSDTRGDFKDQSILELPLIVHLATMMARLQDNLTVYDILRPNSILPITKTSPVDPDWDFFPAFQKYLSDQKLVGEAYQMEDPFIFFSRLLEAIPLLSKEYFCHELVIESFFRGINLEMDKVDCEDLVIVHMSQSANTGKFQAKMETSALMLKDGVSEVITVDGKYSFEFTDETRKCLSRKGYNFYPEMENEIERRSRIKGEPRLLMVQLMNGMADANMELPSYLMDFILPSKGGKQYFLHGVILRQPEQHYSVMVKSDIREDGEWYHIDTKQVTRVFGDEEILHPQKGVPTALLYVSKEEYDEWLKSVMNENSGTDSLYFPKIPTIIKEINKMMKDVPKKRLGRICQQDNDDEEYARRVQREFDEAHEGHSAGDRAGRSGRVDQEKKDGECARQLQNELDKEDKQSNANGQVKRLKQIDQENKRDEEYAKQLQDEFDKERKGLDACDQARKSGRNDQQESEDEKIARQLQREFDKEKKQPNVEDQIVPMPLGSPRKNIAAGLKTIFSTPEPPRKGVWHRFQRIP